MKKIVFIVFVFALFCNQVFAADTDKNSLLEKEYKLDVIVIDPGHGGNDVGAVSPNGLYERDVTFKIATRLKSMIEKNLGIKVYLTRDGNKYVSLQKRTAFANEKDAGLFLSIHANSSDYLSISGCESFFYKKEASDEHSKKLAELENKASSQDDSEPSDIVNLILMDMASNELTELSYNFADIIQQNYTTDVKSRNRGVKQAPFMVLMGAKMPAALTEIGFLSSKKDENKFQNEESLEKITQALFNSVKKYKELIDVKNGKKAASNEEVK